MSKKIQLKVVVVFLMLLALAANASVAMAQGPGVPDRIIYVNAGATGTETGQNWADAYTDLQSALSEARTLAPAENIQIWVAEGIYKPIDGITPGGSPRYEAFEMINNVELYGGFAGGESDLEDRDWRANLTILSGDIDNNDMVNAFGITENPDDIVGDNALHVVRAQDVDDSARVDGFYISGGLANLGGLVDGTFSMRKGAGIYLLDSQVHLAGLQIQGNLVAVSSGQGGGAYFDRGAFVPGTPTIQLNDVHFINNRSEGQGGGLYIDGPLTSIDGAVFTGNVASGSGGGLSMVITLVDIRNALIADNQAAEGGGIYSFRGTAAIVNSQISGNFASVNGGAFYFDHSPNIDGTTVLTNTTLSGNRADGIGGGVFHEQPERGTMLINNSILWNNQDSSGLGTAGANYGGPGAARFEALHSLIQGLNPTGEGNLDGTLAANDPQFNEPADPALAPTALGDLRVASDSAIIDRGTGSARVNPVSGTQFPPIPIEGEILFDLDGNDRITDGLGDGMPVVDLGPFELPGILYTIGGEVAGLIGDGLILRLNEAEELSISMNGTYQFISSVPAASQYTVSIIGQPIRPPQHCTLTNAIGMAAENISNVDVNCVDLEDGIFEDRFQGL